jgi:hypothetical protein
MLYLCILCGWTSVSVDAKQDDKTAGRYTLSLDGGEWHLWQDKQAEWKNDKLFLPEDATDLSLLPVNVPTGGWEQLNPANATAVQVPGTVEEYCTVSSRPSPDDGAGVSWWFRTIKLPATLKGRRVLIHFESVRMRAEIYLDRKLVGYDMIGESPFDVDITEAVKPELLKQKSRTQFSLYLAQLKFIGTDEEKTIRQYLQTSNADEDFINEIVGHLYKMQKDYGKAFLTHNRIEDLRQNPDPNIINSLMSNAEKENDQALLTQLYELEGTYFLRMNNFEEAAKWFAKVPPSYSITHYDYDYETEKYIPVEILPNEFNGYSKISPLIFSNGFKRLFSVPADSQLTDTMYEQYPYLNQEHDKATLTAALMQLEKESQMMTEESARAAYMLANYYYNISPTGYYRNIPTYFRDNSYCWSAYGSYGSAVSNRIPDYSKEYNYRDFTQEYMTINNMENALALYEQAATYFTDREWKARALFMASSCTMDLYAQNWWDNWNNILDPDFKRSDEEKKVDSYFYQLAKSYSDTQFFKQAVHECKYFDYYVKNEF